LPQFSEGLGTGEGLGTLAVGFLPLAIFGNRENPALSFRCSASKGGRKEGKGVRAEGLLLPLISFGQKRRESI
jgi:hypothetical protein